MKIPNRISFFWSGGPLSWMRYMSLWSFRFLNPTWEIYLYLDCRLPQNGRTWTTGEPQDCDGTWPAEGRKCYLSELAKIGVQISQWQPPADAKTLSPIHLADLCRWGVLSQYGGWFADTDILFVDSMERVEQRYNADRISDEQRKGPGSFKEAEVALPLCRDWLPTGLIGAVKDNRFTSDLYVMARNSADPRRYHSAGREAILRAAGLDYEFPPDKMRLRRGLITGFPGTVFWLMHHLTCYRWEWFDSHVIFEQNQEVLPDTVGIHWYGGSRSGQRANRKYVSEHAMAADVNVFTSYARDLLAASRGQAAAEPAGAT